MENIKLVIQYDGLGFSGFELQPHKRTVRAELEKAINTLFNRKVKLINSSRTDAGVHAIHLVVNFKVETKIPTPKIIAALNGLLPEDIRCWGLGAGDWEHARYDAKSKEYEYLIYNGQILPPHIRQFVWHVKPKLDLRKMKKEAKKFIGRHDFRQFCAAGSGKSDFVRTIHSLEIGHWKLDIWHRGGAPVISIRVRGDGFLYKMVRNIVGRLVEAGLGQEPRRHCAPGQGLCLVDVSYR